MTAAPGMQASLFGAVFVPRGRGQFRTGPVFLNPCGGCPLESAVKVLPVLPPGRCVTVVGLGPWTDEVKAGAPFVGEGGRMLRRGLTQAGLDPARDVGHANLGRCQPPGGFESAEWAAAEARCWHHLCRDLGEWAGPLLLLGSRPLQRFAGGRKASVRRERGLWKRLPGGRDAFVALHPAGILRAGEPGTPERDRLEAQFRADCRRMADRLLGREWSVPVRFRAYQDPADARHVLRALAGRGAPWYFDIETTDAAGSPARPGVATDPFHPDFRVRGVAVAVGPDEGFWVELAPWEDVKDQARALLAPAFGSSTEKGAFVSGFDANGLIAQGWVSEVRNLTRDPWLAAVALDAKGGGHSLERLVVDVLGEPQPKAGVDRTRIREMSLEAVAEYAVRDACCEWRLDAALRERLERGEYL